MKIVLSESETGTAVGEKIGEGVASTLAIAEVLVGEGLSKVGSFAKSLLLGTRPGFNKAWGDYVNNYRDR